jgi:hypothetical protein
MPRARLAGLCCAAAVFASPAHAADPRAADLAPGAPRPEVVALRYAWPRDLAADVEYARTRAQTGRPSTSVQLRGKLAASPRGKGVAVRYQGWAGAQGEAAAMLRAAERVVLVVGEDGQAQAVEGTREAAEALRKIPPFDSDAPQVRKVLELAPASLEKEARELWAVLVGFWNENDLEIGEAYVSESEVPIPAVPGSTVRLRVEARAARWVDCPRPERGRCVELTMRSRPDREDVARVVGALMEKLGVPKQAVQGALGELATVMDATVVTEPSTLVPHRVDVKRTSEAAGPGGEAITRVDERRWTYVYPRPAKGKR